MQTNSTTQKTFKSKPLKTAYNDVKQSNNGKTWKRENDKRAMTFNGLQGV